MQEPANQHDVQLFRADRMITMTGDPAEAIAALGGVVIASGGLEDLRRTYPKAPVTDFGAATVMPGFNDAHIHLAMAAELLLHPDVSPDTVGSIGDIQDVIRAEAAQKPPGSWIKAYRYDDGKTAENRVITRWDLDQAAPDHPVLIIHIGAHWGVANSTALAAVGIDESSTPPEGGQYGRGADERLNGILYENALFDLAYPQLADGSEPIVPSAGFDDRITGLKRAVEMFHAAGLTSVCDALVGPDDLRLFIEAQRRGMLTLRVNMLMAAEHYGKMNRLGLVGELGGPQLRLAGIKTFVDGAIGGRTCYMEQPFEGSSDDYGIQTRSTSDLRDIIRTAHEDGTRVCIHANGDRAIKLILGLFEEAQQAAPREALRHRIEHCTIVNEDIMNRIKRLNAIAVPFGSYVDYHGSRLLEWYGEERLSRMFAHKWFMQSGVGVAGSSDYPCGPFEPLRGIQSCATRRGFDGAVMGENQKVGVADALWLYTVGSAVATGEGHYKGRLAPGFLADFVVLRDDPTAVDPTRISQIPVLETWVGAERVWQNDPAAALA